MRYTDELEAVVAYAQGLRRQIAERLAEEAGHPVVAAPTEAQLAAADEAVEAWREDGEEMQDRRAFRDIGPLQELLASYCDAAERIDDILDRRLS